MPIRLERRQHTGDLHFITFSCDGREPYLVHPEAKQTLEQIIDHTRRTHDFKVYAYVLMPEHVHLLLSEPTKHPLSTSLQVIKTESSKVLKGTLPRFWLPRYHDFNVYTEAKRIEKTRYIHRNPVTRGLVHHPSHYPWSSYNFYASGAKGRIEISIP